MIKRFDFKHQKLKLNNGAQIFYVPIPYAQTITVMALVNSGPRYDPIHKTGLSHLIEHIKLRNTNGTSLPSQIEEVGSSPRGFTYFETNKYWINLIPEYSTQGIEFLCRILNESKYTDAVVEKEKKTVLEELRIIESNPNKNVWEVWTKHIFRGEALGNGYIGDSSTMNQIDKNDVTTFINTWYTPTRTTFIITGNLTSAAKKSNALLVETMMNRPINNVSGTTSARAELSLENPISIEKSATKTLNVIVGFRTVPIDDNEQAVFTLIQAYLNGGLQSRFGQKLVLDGLVYFVDSFAYHVSDTGYFCIQFTALPDNLHAILQKIYKEIQNLSTGNIDTKWVESAKRYAIFQQRLQLNSPLEIANFYARRCPYSNKHILDPREEDARISQITQQMLCETAKKYFTRKALRIAVVGNIEKDTISVDF